MLRDNYEQNVVLANAHGPGRTACSTLHQRFIRRLERDGQLDRALEFLPDRPADRASGSPPARA